MIKRLDLVKIFSFRIVIIFFTLFAFMFYGNEIIKYTKYLKKLSIETSNEYDSKNLHDGDLYENTINKQHVVTTKKSIWLNIGKIVSVFITLIVYLKYNKSK